MVTDLPNIFNHVKICLKNCVIWIKNDRNTNYPKGMYINDIMLNFFFGERLQQRMDEEEEMEEEEGEEQEQLEDF